MREKYESLSASELREVAKARGLKGISGLRKDELVERMLEEDAKEQERQIEEKRAEFGQLDSGIEANGILEVLSDGYGFIRSDNYMPGENDVYVSPSQIRHFFWPFIDQQNDQMHLRIIAQNRLRRFLQKGSFTCLWRRNDHSPLSLTNRADQIGDPHGHTSTGPFQTKSLIRENRGHILKIPPAAALIRRHSIDRSHI